MKAQVLTELKIESDSHEMRTLTDNELGIVSGGFILIGLVVYNQSHHDTGIDQQVQISTDLASGSS